MYIFYLNENYLLKVLSIYDIKFITVYKSRKSEIFSNCNNTNYVSNKKQILERKYISNFNDFLFSE